jgi:predicted nucleotide-binding protein (sugar kinase/HSP70/actin superfamily)
MNLKEQIRRILKEERNMNIGLRRRLVVLDGEFYRLMHEVYRDNICGYSSSKELLDVVIESVAQFMYFNCFQHYIDDNTGEWGEIYYEMVEYIKNKYGKEIIEYYHVNCRK